MYILPFSSSFSCFYSITTDESCPCSTCKHYTRAFLHTAFKDNNALAAQLLTKHNIAYMMSLMRTMRSAILGGTDTYEQFIRGFLVGMFPKGDIPLWTVDALGCAGFKVQSTVTSRSDGSAQHRGGMDGEGGGEGDRVGEGDRDEGRDGDGDGVGVSVDVSRCTGDASAALLEDNVLKKKRKGSEDL